MGRSGGAGRGGRIYLKEGRNVTFKGRDRLKIPRRKQDVKGWRNAYGQDKRKEKFAVEEVDSVVCWNSRYPERQRRFILADGIGWCWVYFETPHILTLVFAKRIRHCRGRRHPGVAAARDIPSVACGLLLAEARGGGILVCGQSQGEDREEVPGTAVRIRAGGCGTVPADTRGGHVARQDYRAVDGILSGGLIVSLK